MYAKIGACTSLSRDGADMFPSVGTCVVHLHVYEIGMTKKTTFYSIFGRQDYLDKCELLGAI